MPQPSAPTHLVPTRLRAMVVIGTIATMGLLLASVRPAGAAAIVLYVDKNNPSCTDSGSGTQTVPYCTITKGASVAVAGQTVQVAAGTYAERATVGHSGTAGSPIVLTPGPGASVTVTGQADAFKVSGKSWVTIQGFTVTGTTSYGIYVTSSSNIVISGNTVSHTASYGIHVNTSSKVTVSGNDVSSAGQRADGYTKYGIKLAATTTSLVSRNVSHDNSEAGIFLDATTNGVEVTGNQAYRNARGYARAAPGIDVRGYANTIDRNISHDNEDTGLQFYTGSHDNLVVDNLAYYNGDHGIDDLGSTGQRIISNTVWWNYAAGINVEGSSTGATIQNNIAVDNGYDTSPCFTPPCNSRTHSNIRVDSTSTSRATVDSNLVYLTQSGTMYVWGSTSYSSLAAFKAATGQESHGLQDDPKWVSTGSNFHLLAGSPAIDSADSGVSGETSTDLEGNGRVDDPATPSTGTGPRTYDDRGAYEFQPSAPPTTTTASTTTTTAPTTTTTSTTSTITTSTTSTTTTSTTTTSTTSTTSTTAPTTTTIPGGTNLVANPGFETDLTGWKAYGSGSLLRVTGGHSGSWAAEADNPTTASASCGLNDSPNWIATTQAGTYTVSIWVRGDVANSVKLNLREYASGTNVGSKTVTVTVTPTWQLVSLTYTTVSPGSTLDLNTYSSSAVPGQCFQADDVSETLS
jgi:parallel beta-helix repeat protein